MKTFKNPLFIALIATLTLSMPSAGLAQRVPASDLMPPPKAAPRTPVKSEKLAETRIELKGQATAQDGGTLHLQTFDGRGHDMRLAGVVIAPLTDTKGIAARVALDDLVRGRTITCLRRDRDTDGKLLVTCARDDGIDLGMQMLRDGVTLFTRSGNLSDEFARAYREVESEAQQARRGIWASVPQMPVSAANKPKAIKPVIIEGAETDEATQENTVQVPQKAGMAAPVPVATTANQMPAETPMQISETPATLGPVAAAPTAQKTWPEKTWSVGKLPAPEEMTDTMGFFFAASLIGTLLLGISLFDFLGRRRVRYAHEWEARNTRQVVAAALGGELSAARDVCDSRAHSIATGAPVVWPRLRSYVYQTHVDKIGMLGPVLARQIATIYGQMADYATATKEDADALDRTMMIKSLQRLCGYMDVALEGLAEIEGTGEVPIAALPADYQPKQQRVAAETPARAAIAHKPAEAAKSAARPARPEAKATQKNYPTYDEVATEKAAQRIMEEEILRARAEELLKAKASPMKRRANLKPTAPQNDTHHADLLGLEDDVVEAIESAPVSRRTRKA